LGKIPQIEFEARQFSLVRASKDLPISSWEVDERYPLAKVL